MERVPRVHAVLVLLVEQALRAKQVPRVELVRRDERVLLVPRVRRVLLAPALLAPREQQVIRAPQVLLALAQRGRLDRLVLRVLLDRLDPQGRLVLPAQRGRLVPLQRWWGQRVRLARQAPPVTLVRREPLVRRVWRGVFLPVSRFERQLATILIPQRSPCTSWYPTI